MRFIPFIFCLVWLLWATPVAAQLDVNTTQTPQQLVEDVLIGQGVQVSNIQFTGDPMARGYFNGANSNIGLSRGNYSSYWEMPLTPLAPTERRLATKAPTLADQAMQHLHHSQVHCLAPKMPPFWSSTSYHRQTPFSFATPSLQMNTCFM
jgi:hypothetical protein